MFGRCRQFANGIVAGVGDVEIRLLVEGQPRRLPKKRCGTWSGVGVACTPRAGHGAQRTGLQVEAADHIVIGIGDVQPVAVHSQRAGLVEGRGNQRPDDAATIDPSHPVVEGVGDVNELPLGVPGDAIRGIELGRHRRTLVAGIAEAAGSRDGGDHGRLGTRGVIDRRDGDGRLAHLVGIGVGDIDVEAGHLVTDLRDLPDRDRIRAGQLGLGRISAVARNRKAPGARKGHLRVVDQQPNDMVGRVGDEGVAAKDREAEGLLGDLGRLASRGRPGIGREVRATGERSRGRYHERRGDRDLGEGETHEKGGWSDGAPPPDPHAAPSLHTNPPCVDDPCCIIPRTQPPHRRRTRSLGCERPGVTRKGASASIAEPARSPNGLATIACSIRGPSRS